MNNSKEENGITLIALIITIIVLLILAGVSIAMVVGDNGVLGQAINATTATDVAETKEAIELEIIGRLDENGDYTVATVLEVAKEITGNDVDTSSETVESAKGNTVDISDILDGAKVSWYYDDDGNVTNGSVTLAIGDYVNYDPTNYDGYAEDADTATYTSEADVNGYEEQKFKISSYTYDWRVLGADEETGELLLISDDFICPYSGGYTNATYNRTYFYLSGQAGYANCERELNAICAIFGNGYGATGARSINVDDINKITGYDPDTAAYESGNIYAYGNEVTYTYNGSSSTAYDDGNGHSGTYGFSFTYYTGTAWKTLASGEDVTLTSTSYIYYPNTLTTSSSGDTVGISTTSAEYYILFTNSSTGAYSGGAYTNSGFNYWLASPCVFCRSGYASFTSFVVASCRVNNFIFYYSYVKADGSSSGVRAAVTLGSDVSLEWNDTTNKWEIQ